MSRAILGFMWFIFPSAKHDVNQSERPRSLDFVAEFVMKHTGRPKAEWMGCVDLLATLKT
ncbi:MAG: hypothetical protein K9J77_08490 [Rhodoferax sp.]|nr:hypothetical protein [Rhodoferax sp.]